MSIHHIDQKAYSAVIEGYASIFNAADENGDIVAPGAFSRDFGGAVARRREARMLYQHEAHAPIGRWRMIREDARGLFVSGELLLRSDLARDVYALVEGGAIDGLSIGFQTIKARKEPGGRRILKADLWEVSVVTFPMAHGARITKVGPPRQAPCPATPLPSPDPAAFADHLYTEAMRGAAAILTS